MHAFSTLSAITFALLGAQRAAAWRLEFWGTQSTCNVPKGSAADFTAGEDPRVEQPCGLARYDVKAMKVTDWDEGCTIKVIVGDLGICDGKSGDVVYEKDLATALADGDLDDSGTGGCIANLGGRNEQYSYAYICGDEE